MSAFRRGQLLIDAGQTDVVPMSEAAKAAPIGVAKTASIRPGVSLFAFLYYNSRGDYSCSAPNGINEVCFAVTN